MQVFIVLLLVTAAFASPAVFQTKDPSYHTGSVHGSVHHQTPVHHQPQPFVAARHGGSFEHAVQGHVEHQLQTKHHYSEPVDVAARHKVVSHDDVPVARILQQDMEVNPDGSYYNVWNSDNGISVSEQGAVKHVGDSDVVVSNGELSYTDNEGQQYYIKYVADENGFQPQGAHLPTPPPIPLGIARGLEYIKAHPYQETTTYGPHKGFHQGHHLPVVVDN